MWGTIISCATRNHMTGTPVFIQNGRPKAWHDIPSTCMHVSGGYITHCDNNVYICEQASRGDAPHGVSTNSSHQGKRIEAEESEKYYLVLIFRTTECLLTRLSIMLRTMDWLWPIRVQGFSIWPHLLVLIRHTLTAECWLISLYGNYLRADVWHLGE